MKRYAFVDVQNTDTTTKQLLGFLVDWNRLYGFLKNEWKCGKVFFYSGIDDGDFEYLVRKIVQKGVLAHLVSSAKKIKSGPKYYTSRFSTRLRKLIEEIGRPVDFLNIDNIRKRIERPV